MIKAVLFDFGGVLTEGGKVGSTRAMFAAVYGIDPQDVQMDDSALDAFCGRITDEQFVQNTNRLNPGRTPATIDMFMEHATIFNRCKPVYALADAIRTQGIVTGIFSNVYAISADALRRDGYYDNFSPLILSCGHGMMKPEPALYKAALRELNLDAREVLFIDDNDQFLEPARELGMYTVLAVSPEQIVHDVRTLISKENGAEL
jgi:putative hydrolase of the HAD superfamily